MPASHVAVILVPADPLVSQFPTNGPRKAAEHVPTSWTHATQLGHVDEAPAFRPQPGPAQPIVAPAAVTGPGMLICPSLCLSLHNSTEMLHVTTDNAF